MTSARLLALVILFVVAGDRAVAVNAPPAPDPAAATELAAARAAYLKAADQARDLTAERDSLRIRLAQMTNAAVTCQAKNARLVAFAEALLEDYRKAGLGRVLFSREPFLGLERVKLENLVQDREDTIRANRCNQRIDSAPPTAPASK